MGVQHATLELLQEQADSQKKATAEYLSNLETTQSYYEQQDQINTLELVLESLQQQPAAAVAETTPAKTSNQGMMLFVFLIAIITFLSRKK